MIRAKILADSVSTLTGDRLTTYELTYQRFIHSEVMTHRELSRNAASSRAIPVKKMLGAVIRNPAVPVHWGKNQKGMQASGELSGFRKFLSRRMWLTMRWPVVICVWLMMKIGLHKQVANRLLEPWMHMTIIASGTEWENFFKLRMHKDAQPEIKALANEMWWALGLSFPNLLKEGQWHAPLLSDQELRVLHEDLTNNKDGLELDLALVSSARCARVSYTTHDGKRPLSEDVGMAKRLISAGHMSPLEHVAVCSKPNEVGRSNFRGFKQLRKFVPGESGRTRE